MDVLPPTDVLGALLWAFVAAILTDGIRNPVTGLLLGVGLYAIMFAGFVLTFPGSGLGSH